MSLQAGPCLADNGRDGLHQAVEAKHKKDGVVIKQETQTLSNHYLAEFLQAV